MTRNVENVFCSVIEFNYFADKFAALSGYDKDSEDVLENRVWSSKEYRPKFIEEVKGKRVIITATDQEGLSPQEIMMRVYMVADAAKREGAEEVIANIPYLFYCRQDRAGDTDPKLKGESHTTFVNAKTLQANGVDKVMTVHLHSRVIYESFGEAYFSNEISDYINKLPEKLKYDSELKRELSDEEIAQMIPRMISKKKEELGRKVLFNLNPNPLMAHYLRFRSGFAFKEDDSAKPLSLDEIKAYRGENIVFVSPDAGAKHHIYDLQRLCFLPDSQYCNLKKLRTAPNDEKKVFVELDEFSDNFTSLEGQIIIYGDDQVDTGGTLTKANAAMVSTPEYGTPAATMITATHAVLAGDNSVKTQQKMWQPYLKEVVFTNTNPTIENRRITKFRKISSVLRVAEFMSDALENVVIPGKDPRDVYQYNSLDDLMAVQDLYYLKGSSSHFLGRNR